MGDFGPLEGYPKFLARPDLFDRVGDTGSLHGLRLVIKERALQVVSTYAYVNPLVAILLGGQFAREPLNARILIAALVIIGSVVLINATRRVKPVTRPVLVEKE